MLRCWLGHWRWWCPGKNGYHLCPQFCRCCTFRKGDENPDAPWGFSMINFHWEEKCVCNRKCGCHKWFK